MQVFPTNFLEHFPGQEQRTNLQKKEYFSI